MNSKVRIFVVDDHDVFRDGIKLLMSNSQVAEVIGEACNGQEFLDNYNPAETDVVIMDISMPVMDGIKTTQILHEKHPHAKVLVLTMYGEERYYYQMIQNGIKGFILKSAGIKELLKGITEVAQGNFYFSNELFEKVITSFTSKKAHPEMNESELTKREIEVLKLIAVGKTNDQISSNLNISEATVRTHKANLISKTGCVNTASLVMYAIKNQYISVT